MRSRGLACALWALAALAPLGAAAQPCVPEVREAPDIAIIEYDPFLAGATVRELVFEVAGGEAGCAVDLAVLGPGDVPQRFFDVGGARVEVRPTEDDGMLPQTDRPGVYRLVLPPGQAMRATLDAVVVRGAVLDAGDHRADVRFEFYEPGTVRPMGARWLTSVVLRSLPRAQLNVTGAAGSFGTGQTVSVVDFGEAEAGARRRVFLQVRANTLSRLTISSENGGVLRHAARPDEAVPIAYAASLDGEPLDLTQAVSQDRDPPRTLAGRSLPLDIELGAVAGAMAGRYEDVLTVEFSPL